MDAPTGVPHQPGRRGAARGPHGARHLLPAVHRGRVQVGSVCSSVCAYRWVGAVRVHPTDLLLAMCHVKRCHTFTNGMLI